jgi:4-hydroxy-tetrahydrodipicolinate reductase
MSLPIAIVGYGAMGRLVERLAPECNCVVTAIIDPLTDNPKITAKSVAEAEVLIDFSTAFAVRGNTEAAAKLGKNLVIGTTGWGDELDAVAACGKKIGILYGANFSIGVNIFYQIVETAARLLDAFPEYDPFGVELHHKRKADSPSGTAKQLTSILLEHVERKQKTQFDRLNRRIETDELHFASVRAGSFPGTHLVGFDSPSDTIELRHTVRNREGLALGALRAARWIRGRRGFHHFPDIFPELFEAEERS